MQGFLSLGAIATAVALVLTVAAARMNASTGNWMLVAAWALAVVSIYSSVDRVSTQPPIPRLLWTAFCASVIGLVVYEWLWTVTPVSNASVAAPVPSATERPQTPVIQPSQRDDVKSSSPVVPKRELRIEFNKNSDVERIGSQLRGTIRIRNAHDELSLQNVALRIASIEILAVAEETARAGAITQIERCTNASLRRSNEPYSITQPIAETVPLLAAGGSVPFRFVNVGDGANVVIELARNNVQYARGIPNYLSDDCALPRGGYRVRFRAEAQDVRPQAIAFVIDNTRDEITVSREQ